MARSKSVRDAQPRAALVTFTSDFGTAEGYAAAMKGVVSAGAPNARLVDISHDIPPGNVASGAWCLRVAVPEFPPGTIHVAVVDPGVGSDRRPVVVGIAGQTLVGPDNGLLAMIPGEVEYAWAIDPSRVARDGRLTATFHGRDVFAPAAARIASGESPRRFCARIDPGTLAPPPVDLTWIDRGTIASGRIVHVDCFGNLVTSLPEGLLERAAPAGGSVRGRHVLPPVACYEAISPGSAAFIAGSQGLVEISARGASAALMLRARVGDEVRMPLRSAPRSGSTLSRIAALTRRRGS